MKMRKRFLSILLSVIMLFSMIPMSVMSEENNTYSPKVKSVFNPITPLADRENMLDMLDGDYAYITDESMIEDKTTESGYSIRTGTGPWDDDDVAGNDSNELNNKVRTFDIASYDFEFTTRVRPEAPALHYEKGNLYFEFVLQGSSNEIQFEESSMGWLTAKNATYTITEEVVSGKVSQVMRGVVLLTPNGKNLHAIGEAEQSLNVYFRVLAMKNGEKIAPAITMWLEGNDIGKDYTDWGTSAYNGGSVTGNTSNCEAHAVKESVTINAPAIEVSATPRYNVRVGGDSDSANTALGTFDFSTGNELALNRDAGKVEGRIRGIGLSINIVGKPGQGLRGVELPKDDSTVTFDLKLSAEYTYMEGETEKNVAFDIVNNGDFAPLIWSFDDNNRNRQINKDGRSMLFDGLYSHITSTPINKLEYKPEWTHNCAYDGGNWSVKQDGDILHVTVKNMRVNPLQIPYTNSDSGSTVYTFYNPENIKNYWDVETFYLSTGGLWIVQPFYSKIDGQYLAEKYGEGTTSITVTDSNLQMTTASGVTIPMSETNTNQAVQDDDARRAALALINPGTISQLLAYNTYKSRLYSESLTSEGFKKGTDWIAKGNGVTLWGETDWWGKDTHYRLVAVDNMIKFDDAFFDPEGTFSINIKSANFLFAAKPDGTGWNHGGLKPGQQGYDSEMINATPDDLVFFSSLSELKEKGFTCVGVMAEARMLQESTNGTGVAMYVDGHAKETAESGQVYMISPYARTWCVSDLAKASGISSSDILNMTDKERNALIRQYIPSAVQMESATNCPDPSWTNGGRDGISGQSDTIRAYSKAQYDETGYLGSNEDFFWGDSCLVVSHETHTAINVEQTTPDNKEKQAFDLDATQRIVDYGVSPSIKVKTSGGETASQKTKTTITQTIKLPKTLNYIEGSMFMGGTYSSNGEGKRGTITGGTQLLENGTINFTDGKGNSIPVRFDVVNETDGTTFIITMDDVVVTGAEVQYLEKLYFSATIGTPGREDTDVKNNEHIAVTTEIFSSEDRFRARTIANGNAALTDIQVSKLNEVNLSKFADQNVVELTDSMGFTMNVGNNTDSSIQITVVDGLPYNGDGYTRYSGEQYITEFSVLNPSELDMDKLSFYYTTEKSERGHDSNYYQAQMTDFATDSKWKPLVLNAEGKASVPAQFQPVAIVAVGTLEGGKVLTMHLTMELPDAQAGDRVENRLTKDNLSTSATSRIVQRSIEGLTWLDSNYNGLQDADEKRQNGVKVTLQKKDENTQQYEDVVSIQTGQKIDVIRGTSAQPYDYSVKEEDNAGRYRFDNLLPGIYRVVFENGDAFEMDYYRPSPVEIGDDIKNSDAVPTVESGILKKTQIDGIVMNLAKELTLGSQNISHLDSGFDIQRTTLKVKKEWDDQDNKYGKRPDSIQVQLYADGVAQDGKTATLNAYNNWTYEFKNLPKLREDDHTEITYSAKEITQVAGYKTDNGQSLNQEQTVVNTINKTESGTASFQIKKLREGDDAVAVPGAVFTLSDGQTATTDENGIATFNFNFGDEKDKVTLTLTETSAPAGYTKSDAVWTVTLTRGETPKIELKQNVFEIIWNWIVGVDKDYKDGILTVYNSYQAEDDLTLEGTKVLTGRTLQDEEFTFTVKEAGQVVATGKNHADGSIAFDKIHYTYQDAGTHIYTVTEDNGQLGGVTYSDQSFTVTVNVVDNKDGTLTITPSYPNGGIVFENQYEAAKATVSLKVKKNYKGAELKDNQFSFELKDADGRVIETRKNSADGTISFADLNFTETGIYNYTVSEVIGKETNVTYDTTVYTVKITVTDNGEGQLIASVDTQEKELLFNNIYIPEEPAPEKLVPEEPAPEKSVPQTPKTGDETMMELWLGFLAVSCFGVIVGMIGRKKRKHS